MKLTLLTSESQDHIYLGVTDAEEEGTWRLIDGTLFSEVYNHENMFMKWKVGEPNNYDGREDCMQIRVDHILNDASCDRTNSRGLCERKTVRCIDV